MRARGGPRAHTACPVVTVMEWLVLLLLGLGALADCRTRRIPNTLVLLIMGLAWSARITDAGPVMGTLTALVAWTIGVLPWATLWACGRMGAGDAKYFAAGAMLLPIPVIWQAVTVAALLGGVMGAGLLVRHHRQARAWHHAQLPGADAAAPSPPTLPYAVPMGLALVLVHWWADAPS